MPIPQGAIASRFYDPVLYATILSYLHVPYIWGGEWPLEGLDCSGFVIDVLQTVGVLPHRYENTAQGLFNHFIDATGARQNVVGLGALVFYGSGLKDVSHVDLMVDPHRVVGAIGGTGKTTTPALAKVADARIKMRPLGYRSDRLSIIRPAYVTIGEIV